MNEIIVLVPGMYSPRVVMNTMARRLQKHGFNTLIFSNRFLSETPSENAQRLLHQIKALDAPSVHLLGHSLGGIVVMHLLKLNSELAAHDQIADGRVVLMGAPVQGSELARLLFRMRWVRPFLGKSVNEGLLGNVPIALHGRQTGVICGSSRRGVSALFFKLAGTNDGVVSQSETEIDDASDAFCIPQSHALMLFSKESVEKSAAFFRSGRFV